MAERERKTALMQRVNAAYGNSDLLALLALQLEIEQIDQAALNTISEDRLKRYNKILTEQLAELRAECMAVELTFKMRFDILSDDPLSPERAMHRLQANIRRVRRDIEDLRKDLALFQDIKNMKGWLKQFRTPRGGFF
jgi:hypothetical protein